MAYMTEKEFSSKLKRLQIENEQREKIRTLKKEKWKYFPKFKLPSTSKLVVLVVFLLCIEVIIFCEYAMLVLGDGSAMYALIGAVGTLISTVLGYFKKSTVENSSGGIVYETAMAQLQTSSTDESNAVG